ncbi:MAG: choice-of-anchor H family protein [Candidatus Thiodiazotropha sp.]
MWTSARNNMWLGALILLCAMSQSQTVWADDSLPRYSQSVEGMAMNAPADYTQQLDQASVVEAPALISAGSEAEAALMQRTMVHPAGQLYSIFDASTVLSRDDDDDGFYHRIRVSFDADVSSGEAWVYAKLYLSLEGGRWNHIYTTEVFPIDGDAIDDRYEVVTRLLDGYPTGYYDVLIELYDADYDLLMVNYGPYEDRDLAVLPMEDSYRDSDEDYGGGGALDLGLLVMLVAIGVVWRRRKPGLKSLRDLVWI